MKSKYEIYKQQFVKDMMGQKEEIDFDTYTELKDYERDHKTLGTKNTYYKITYPEKISEAEINQALQIKMYNQLEAMNKKQKIMQYIIVFWFILTLVSIFGTVYGISRIFSAFNSIVSSFNNSLGGGIGF